MTGAPEVPVSPASLEDRGVRLVLIRAYQHAFDLFDLLDGRGETKAANLACLIVSAVREAIGDPVGEPPTVDELRKRWGFMPRAAEDGRVFLAGDRAMKVDADSKVIRLRFPLRESIPPKNSPPNGDDAA